ncbi:hypothetical protein HNQ07_003120 [Deinococcus metalli]|uniref:DUF11 domain-containing protein n=1 Tax=Deinococcus metalli TaxID=1141878 RepID=A0A7W8KG85_9DEIO|nr:DUF11 domain-containing protein [Deinococcus metalli]MBB5377621.1 hypothetical protein [Deinococcus metalli]GHF52110.1 hypothetical protein GCM10017781_30480 [Deinococcus metalli]
MKPNANRLVLALTALLMAGAAAGAAAPDQDTSLPLTSVGDRLMWTVGDQNLTLDVPTTGRVRLELYSPRVDQGDYRSDTYYGDEQYDGNRSAVTTTFTLLRPDGSVLLARTFTPGAHGWETLVDQDLPAGSYRVVAATQGNGKNTFAVRLAGVSAMISTDRLRVNVHSRAWVPAVKVTTDGQPHVLRMYDGDGPTELEAQLRDADGNVSPLTVSADLAFSDITLPAAAGTYTVELRQPAAARQFSNTVGFSLTRAGSATPIVVSRVDHTGTLRVTAELLLPGGAQPTTADVTVGDTPVTVNGTAERTVEAGTYTVVPVPVPGAEVAVDTSRVTVLQGSGAGARVQIRPQVKLSLQADKTEVCVGDTVTLTARASTDFGGELPMRLSVDAPGLEITGTRTLDGTLSALRPGELRVTGTATTPGPLNVTARLAPWEQEQTLALDVQPDVTSLQLSRDAIGDAAPGSELTVGLRVTNTAARPVLYDLTDTADGNLTQLDSPHFTGRLAPGETRVLSYRARVGMSGPVQLRAQLSTPDCAATQTSAATVTVQRPAPTPTPVAAAAPAQRRVSRVLLPYDAPVQATEVVIAHTVPDGATYVPGSSRSGDTALPDPLRGPGGTLYWALPGTGARSGTAMRGTVTYSLAHTGALGALPRPALLARYTGDRSEVLEGRIDAADLAAARPLSTPAPTQNAGRIALPLDGSLIRVRDRISVTVQVPAGQDAALSVNGQAVKDDQIGEITTAADGARRVTYVGVLLAPGRNTLSSGPDTVHVQLVGATARTEVTPVRLVADGSSPLRVKIRTLDAQGNLTDQPSVTVNSSLEPLAADAEPGTSGYQVRLDGGEGELVLQPQATPTTLHLAVQQGTDVRRYTFEVTPDQSRVGVGMVSATLGLDGNLGLDDLRVQARASLETPLAGGKLYLSADTDGLPTDRDTLKRYAAYGDSSVQSVPLQGIDPVALTYDHPDFRVAYRRTALPVDVLHVGEELTALTASSKGDVQVSGFAALVPEDRVSAQKLIPEGTRLLRLGRGDIAGGSDTLEIVTLERGTGKELRRVRLTRNADYLLDLKTGIITLARALDAVDADLNDVVVLASYRLSDPLAQRGAAFGAQVKVRGEHASVGVAVVSLDDTVTTGARATYDDGTVRADGLVAYSGGLQASLDAGAAVGANATVAARVRYQDSTYAGLSPMTPGLSAGVDAAAKLTPALGISAQAEYHDSGSGAARAQGGSVTARADYQLAPFTVGAGLRAGLGDTAGVGAVIGFGYHRAPVDVDVTHVQPLGDAGGTLDPTTTFNVRYALSDTLSVGLHDELNWKTGQRAALTLDSRVGATTYQLAYDLPGSGGQGNRARFGVTTALPLSDRVNVGLRASALYDVVSNRTELGAGADVNYKTDRVSATLGADVTSRAEGFGVVLRSGVSGQLSDQLTLTADGLAEFGAGKSGVRAAVGYAYRGRTVTSLGTARYVTGTLAGGAPEFSTNLAAEYRQPTYAVRAGVDTRTLLSDPDSFTAQLGLGGTYYFGDRFGVGAWGRMITQPGSGSTQYGYGVEGSVRVLPGTWLTAGYNPVGFEGLGTTYTKQGAYLRLDLTIDETLGDQP